MGKLDGRWGIDEQRRGLWRDIEGCGGVWEGGYVLCMRGKGGIENSGRKGRRGVVVLLGEGKEVGWGFGGCAGLDGEVVVDVQFLLIMGWDFSCRRRQEGKKGVVRIRNSG